MMKLVIGIILILAGIALAGFLGIYIMLYGGIMLAIESWGVSNATMVWGIIRMVFFGFGLVPGILLMAIGAAIIEE